MHFDKTANTRSESCRVFYCSVTYGLLNGSGQFCKTSDFSGGGPFVQHTFFGGLVNRRLGRLKSCADFGRLLGCGLTNLFDYVFHAGFHRPVAQALFLTLTRTFKC
jgi:hypothetical protein